METNEICLWIAICIMLSTVVESIDKLKIWIIIQMFERTALVDYIIEYFLRLAYLLIRDSSSFLMLG